jgi:exodeoxyribonuclease VII small subunit
MEKKAPRKKAAKKIDFEKSFAELENLVKILEDGDIPLEDALKNFERGIQLTQSCQKALTEAQQKVQILMNDNDNDVLEDFKPNESTS